MQPLADVPVGREQSLRDLYIFFREGFHFFCKFSPQNYNAVGGGVARGRLHGHACNVPRGVQITKPFPWLAAT
jgi:hypothetical protein